MACGLLVWHHKTYLLRMDSYDKMRLLYLGLLVAVILGSLLMRSRGRMGHVLRQAGLWVVIFGGVSFGIAALQGDLIFSSQNQTVLDDGRIELTMQRDGHYYLTANVNGTPIEFVVDTGASHIVLTQSDAKRAGIDVSNLRYIGSASTANGVVRTAPVTIQSLQVDDVTDKNIRAVVNGGEMNGSLLGMSYLNRFEKIEISQNRLVLTR